MTAAFVPDWTLAADAHPNKRLFSEGLALIMARWSAFQMAVSMEWGGHESASTAQALHGGLLDYFEANAKSVDVEDIEDILLEVMNTEFNVTLEDGSERTTAAAICTMFRECVRGASPMIDALRQRVSQGSMSVVPPAHNDSSSDDASSGDASDDDGMA